MDWRTLLLNSSCEPLATVSWQRAVTLVWVGKVESVVDYAATVRSPSVELPVPAVVRLWQYLHVPRRGVPFTRKNLLERDGYRCQYCLRGLRPQEATLDHVTPRSRGGKRSWENLVVACARCNRRKANRTPREARMALRCVPRRPPALAPGAGLLRASDAPPEWRPYLPRRRAS